MIDSESESKRMDASMTTAGERGAGRPAGGWLSHFADLLTEVREDMRGLRRSARRQGQAQESLHELLEQRLKKEHGLPNSAAGQREPAVGLSSAQIEALTRLDEAVAHLLGERDRGAGASGEELRPISTAEALAMLQVRVRNLQRSFGIEPIPARGCRFDDRLHLVHEVCHRHDLADGMVVEEVRPGYTQGGRVLRPALVVVNRSGQKAGGASYE
ncbi:MAG: nucleotide exchange factor GrpE [Acidobacteriota bacterium]